MFRWLLRLYPAGFRQATARRRCNFCGIVPGMSEGFWAEEFGDTADDHAFVSAWLSPVRPTTEECRHRKAHTPWDGVWASVLLIRG